MTVRIGLARGKLIPGSYYFHYYLDSREKNFKTVDIRGTRPYMLIFLRESVLDKWKWKEGVSLDLKSPSFIFLAVLDFQKSICFTRRV